MTQPIAIQSWCFRHFKPLDSFLTELKKAGVTATELCSVHADFSDPSGAIKVAKTFADAGVTIVAIGVEHVGANPITDRAKFEWCRNAGVKHMSISFAPEAMFDSLKQVEKLADEFDMQLGIHNHGGYDWLGNETILKYVFDHCSKRIGLHVDTAWAIDAKQNPVKWVQDFGTRVVGCHVKDFLYDEKRNPRDVIIGEGILDLTGFMAELKKIDFKGPLVIEYEGDEQNPVPALSQCVQKLKAVM
jgi:sugar phosphate isomerase/epimerase